MSPQRRLPMSAKELFASLWRVRGFAQKHRKHRGNTKKNARVDARGVVTTNQSRSENQRSVIMHPARRRHCRSAWRHCGAEWHGALRWRVSRMAPPARVSAKVAALPPLLSVSLAAKAAIKVGAATRMRCFLALRCAYATDGDPPHIPYKHLKTLYFITLWARFIF